MKPELKKVPSQELPLAVEKETLEMITDGTSLVANAGRIV